VGRGHGMLRGEKVMLRGVTRDDPAALWRCNDSCAVAPAGWGDPHMPQAVARLRADAEREVERGRRDGRTRELAITIGELDYWGAGRGERRCGCCRPSRFGCVIRGTAGSGAAPTTTGRLAGNAPAGSSRRDGRMTKALGDWWRLA